MRRWKKTYHQQEEKDKNTVSYLSARLTSLTAHKALCSHYAFNATGHLKGQEPFLFSHKRLLRDK